MILPILPLGHFLAAVLSLAVPRARRGLLIASLTVDAVLIAILVHMVMRTGTVEIVLGGWPRSLGIELAADWISTAFCGLFLVIAIASSAYLWHEGLKPYFFLLLHLLLGAVLALLFARDLFNMYVILELITLTSFLLVGYDRRPAELWAALKYAVFSAVGMGFYLLGVAVVYAHTGALNLSIIAARIPTGPPQWVPLAAALLVTGVGVKAGIFVFSLWLPDAYASASPLVSGLLSGLIVNMGFIVLLRLSPVFPIGSALIGLGAITGIVGAIYTVLVRDIKRMLAFSTLAQVGYLLIGVGSGATVGAVAYAIAHGLAKGLLFLAGGEAVITSGRHRISDLVHSEITAPVRVGLLVGTLGIIGLPPFAGYIGRELIHAGIIAQVIMGSVSLGTAIAFSRLVPVFKLTGLGRSGRGKVLSYATLALPILLFLPIAGAAAAIPVSWFFSPVNVAKALGLIGAGYLIHRAISGVTISLPERIFRIEQGTLIVLAGFFLVFVLVRMAS